jgi:hypothetical protein
VVVALHSPRHLAVEVACCCACNHKIDRVWFIYLFGDFQAWCTNISWYVVVELTIWRRHEQGQGDQGSDQVFLVQHRHGHDLSGASACVCTNKELMCLIFIEKYRDRDIEKR